MGVVSYWVMDRATRRHLERRGVFATAVRDWEKPFPERNRDFFAWFEESVMGFDSEEYRRRFWREAYRTGHAIGNKPYVADDFCRGRGSIAVYFAMMGVSFFFWIARREIDRHLHRLRRPSYYEAERARRLALAEERRRLRRRRTLNERPCMDAIRDALARARESVEDMVRLGSLMEDLECYVDNSPYFREDGSFAGRRGGIRRLLQGEAPDLYARYKTLMRYKALSKRFRQAVGVGDPIPASSVLPSAEADLPMVAGSSATGGGEGISSGPGTAEMTETGNAMAAGGASAGGAGIGGGDGTGVASAGNAPPGAGTMRGTGFAAALREVREVFRRSQELISDCECSVASLAAQLARRVEPDYAPKAAPETATMVACGGGAERRRDGPNRCAAG